MFGFNLNSPLARVRFCSVELNRIAEAVQLFLINATFLIHVRIIFINIIMVQIAKIKLFQIKLQINAVQENCQYKCSFYSILTAQIWVTLQKAFKFFSLFFSVTVSKNANKQQPKFFGYCSIHIKKNS